MSITVDKSIVDLARNVDRLGRDGLNQDQIAEALSFTNKKELRRALERAGLKLSIENCVRLGVNNQRLSDLIEAGTVEVAQ